MNIYEVHAGSWRRDPADPDRFLNWDELSERLIPYLKEMGYTHVEFLPIAEHPLDESWGYQVTGYYSPTRFKTPSSEGIFKFICFKTSDKGTESIIPPTRAYALGKQTGL